MEGKALARGDATVEELERRHWTFQRMAENYADMWMYRGRHERDLAIAGYVTLLWQCRDFGWLEAWQAEGLDYVLEVIGERIKRSWNEITSTDILEEDDDEEAR